MVYIHWGCTPNMVMKLISILLLPPRKIPSPNMNGSYIACISQKNAFNYKLTTKLRFQCYTNGHRLYCLESLIIEFNSVLSDLTIKAYEVRFLFIDKKKINDVISLFIEICQIYWNIVHIVWISISNFGTILQWILVNTKKMWWKYSKYIDIDNVKFT